MKRLIRLAAKLYPGLWRKRYGGEFEALLDDAGADTGKVFDVLRGAALMQVQRWQDVGTVALLAMVALFALSWWVGRRPYITPGANQVFRMDSNLGFLLEFLVLLILVIVGIITFVAAKGRWVCPSIAALYLGGVVLVSLLTPRTIVSIGDSYCWDLWCVGIRNVTTSPRGQDKLYKADVSLFVDSSTAELQLTGQPRQFFYVMDEQGRRFPILAYSSPAEAKVTVKPGDQVKGSLTFLAPANARSLYLTGDIAAPLWVRLYFGSDLNPFHRRTLLRVV
jgi:hypothetical protein